MPEDLVYLAMIESGFNHFARSHAKAVGPWQFISATGKRYGLTVNWWVFAPNTSSVSLKVSSTVGVAGVGVVGATGSPHPVAIRTAPNTAQRIRFICP
jgi:hypothetical protein